MLYNVPEAHISVAVFCVAVDTLLHCHFVDIPQHGHKAAMPDEHRPAHMYTDRLTHACITTMSWWISAMEVTRCCAGMRRCTCKMREQGSARMRHSAMHFENANCAHEIAYFQRFIDE